MTGKITKLITALLLLAPALLHAQTDTKVESSRAVTSPDGTRTAVVDRFTPVVDGKPERFSGRMLIRVTSSDGTPTRQRYIEASQVRVIHPPVWIDNSRVCAFVYNVAKNSNGIVYFEPATNRAVQVEFVMPTRLMAATGKVEQELTSLEVIEFDGPRVLKTVNVPWNGGSAFPLVLDPLPTFDGRPYDLAFLKELNGAIAAYKDFLNTHEVQSLEPEQASESFSDDNKWLGLLACGGADSYLLAVPLSGGAAAKVLKAVRMVKVPGLTLSCRRDAAGDAMPMPAPEFRFLTAWKDSSTLQVMKEIYMTETETPEVSPVLSLNVSTGAVRDLATTGTLPSTATLPLAPVQPEAMRSGA